MSQRLIYRVEDEDGIGMYRVAGDIIRRMDRDGGDSFQNNSHHPSPGADETLGWEAMGSYKSRERWFFGFASMDQLIEWLCDAAGREAMRAEGLMIQVYSVPEADFRQGLKQAIFRREEQQLMDTVDLYTFTAIDTVRRAA